MEVLVPEKHVNLMIMGYLRGQGYIDTLVTFERESGMYLKVYNRQTVFLKQLLVEGKFRQAESFIDCLESRLGEQVTVCKMGIKKQLFLELIQNKKTGQKDGNLLVDLLSEFETYDQKVYLELCDLFALRNITEHPEYEGWTVLKGRLCVFELICYVLKTTGSEGSSNGSNPGENISQTLNHIDFEQCEKERKYDYYSCFKGLLLNQNIDKLSKQLMRKLENYETSQNLELVFEPIKQNEKFEDLVNSQLGDILNETLPDAVESVTLSKHPAYYFSNEADRRSSAKDIESCADFKEKAFLKKSNKLGSLRSSGRGGGMSWGVPGGVVGAENGGGEPDHVQIQKLLKSNSETNFGVRRVEDGVGDLEVKSSYHADRQKQRNSYLNQEKKLENSSEKNHQNRQKNPLEATPVSHPQPIHPNQAPKPLEQLSAENQPYRRYLKGSAVLGPETHQNDSSTSNLFFVGNNGEIVQTNELQNSKNTQNLADLADLENQAVLGDISQPEVRNRSQLVEKERSGPAEYQYTTKNRQGGLLTGQSPNMLNRSSFENPRSLLILQPTEKFSVGYLDVENLHEDEERRVIQSEGYNRGASEKSQKFKNSANLEGYDHPSGQIEADGVFGGRDSPHSHQKSAKFGQNPNSRNQSYLAQIHNTEDKQSPDRHTMNRKSQSEKLIHPQNLSKLQKQQKSPSTNSRQKHVPQLPESTQKLKAELDECVQAAINLHQKLQMDDDLENGSKQSNGPGSAVATQELLESKNQSIFRTNAEIFFSRRDQEEEFDLARIMNFESFKLIYEGTDDLPIRASCFSPDGQYLCIGSNSKMLNVYSLENVLYNYKIGEGKIIKKNLLLSRSPLHDGPIYSLDYSNRSQVLASGSMDRTCKVIRLAQNGSGHADLQIEAETQLGGHKGMVRSVKFSKDSTSLLTAGQDTVLKLWDVGTGQLKGTLPSQSRQTYSAKFKFDQTSIVGVGVGKHIEIWDSRSMKLSLAAHIGKLSKMNSLSLSHSSFSDAYYGMLNAGKTRSSGILQDWDRHKMAISHQSGEVSIWDFRKVDKPLDVFELHVEDCRSVEYSPSCRYLASSSFDCTVKIYDLESEEVCHTIKDHQDRVVSARWHPFLPLLVTTSADCSFKVYTTQEFVDECDF